MNYDLSRIDYAICGITYPNTLKVIPSVTSKSSEKFAIGDKNGVLQCLCIKDEEPVVQFKTLPGKPITSVQVVIPNDTTPDKIFAASGNEVKGYTKKGKLFLTMETSLSETITSMCVAGNDLVLGSGRVVTQYRDLRELHSYTCEDRVLDVAAFAAPNSSRLRLLVLVANRGAVVSENGQVTARVGASGPGPVRLAVPPWLNTADLCAYYGAADGSIGIISFEGTELVNRNLVGGQSLGAIMCTGWYFGFDATHLAVGRQDGSVQLYLIDVDNLLQKPRLKYTYFCGEPVTSVAGGRVGAEEPELLVSTYSGRVFALRPSHALSAAAGIVNLPQEAFAARRTKLEAEIARLEKQTAAERNKYQRSTKSVDPSYSVPPFLDIQYELVGATEDGWMEARFMAAVPLDMLFLYSKRKLDLETDSAAVLSVCPSQGKANDLLATVRCQAGTRRLWIRIRYSGSSEDIDEATKLLVYALPATAPRVARLVTLQIPALPYYCQHENVEVENEDRAWATLLVSGSFSVAELTTWLVGVFPGEMPRPAGSVTFARAHILLGTVVVGRYQRGTATFKSDNVSTIVTVRDIISNCSIKRSIRVEISCDVHKDCCVRSFQLIENHFKKEYQKSQEINLKKAINSLDLDINTVTENLDKVLCEDYQKAFKLQSDDTETNLREFNETVYNWYTDKRKLMLGAVNNVNTKLMQLKDAVKACNVEQIRNILAD